MSADLVYVAGSGRSGSTLLDRLLDRHPQVVGMGEVHRLCLNPSERRCGCGSTIEHCEFWSPVLDALAAGEGLDRKQWTAAFPTTVVRERSTEGVYGLGGLELLLLLGSSPVLSAASRVSPLVKRHLTMTRNSWTLYDLVAERSGAEIVVDSTKNAARMKLLYMIRPERSRIIHLVRDGRAVVSSARRRTGCSTRAAAKSWYRANRNVGLAIRTIPARQVRRVRYEDLCRDTERVMIDVCEFLGLRPSDAMFGLEPHDYHQIPGNPMLFRREETEILLDDCWRAEFTAADQRAFDAVTRGMNRRYGYE